MGRNEIKTEKSHHHGNPVSPLLFMVFQIPLLYSIWFCGLELSACHISLPVLVGEFSLGVKRSVYFGLGVILTCVVSLGIFVLVKENQHLTALFGAARIETKLDRIVKISNSPTKYIVKGGSYGEIDDHIKIVQAQSNSEWSQDFIIDGVRYDADWVIYLGRYRIYTIGEQIP